MGFCSKRQCGPSGHCIIGKPEQCRKRLLIRRGKFTGCKYLLPAVRTVSNDFTRSCREPFSHRCNLLHVAALNTRDSPTSRADNNDLKDGFTWLVNTRSGRGVFISGRSNKFCATVLHHCLAAVNKTGGIAELVDSKVLTGQMNLPAENVKNSGAVQPLFIKGRAPVVFLQNQISGYAIPLDFT